MPARRQLLCILTWHMAECADMYCMRYCLAESHITYHAVRTVLCERICWCDIAVATFSQLSALANVAL
jgi:hypothetical protein